MSAIENGEFLENITLPSVEPRTEKVEEKMHIQDDNRLLNELENSADELTQVIFACHQLVYVYSNREELWKLEERISSYK